jgi:hypothetical protein
MSPAPDESGSVAADPSHADPRHANPQHADPRHADPRHADPPHAAPTTKEALSTQVPVALALGWTMAVLFGRLPRPRDPVPRQLPSEHELGDFQRILLELQRAASQAAKLGAPAGPLKATTVAAVENLLGTWLVAGADAANEPTDDELAARRLELPRKVLACHTALLDDLACGSPEAELAYELGRSLRNTVVPPEAVTAVDVGAGPGTPTDVSAQVSVTADQLLRVLSRDRVAMLQSWLKTLGPYLPGSSGRVVAISLGRWQALATVALDGRPPGQLKAGPAGIPAVADEMGEDLLRQGDVWVELLTGSCSTEDLLGPRGLVAAGELALQRSVQIVLRILRHYWVALVVLLAALAGILYLAANYLGGAAKVWTSFAAIAASLGVTVHGITSTAGRLAEQAERPIFQASQDEAMAWDVTTMPQVAVTRSGVIALRRAGVAPGRGPGHV